MLEEVSRVYPIVRLASGTVFHSLAEAVSWGWNGSFVGSLIQRWDATPGWIRSPERIDAKERTWQATSTLGGVGRSPSQCRSSLRATSVQISRSDEE
jgi:hypothetical protein